MQKKTIHTFESSHCGESTHSGFSWVREPNFTPPGDDCGVASCVTQEFTAPRVGELRTLLEAFLESIIGTVNATAGVVRLLSPDGHTLEVISSSGLSTDLQEEAEKFSELDCEINDIATLGHIPHASDISVCSSRPNCHYASCQFQSLIAVPLASNSAECNLGVLTMFFDVSQKKARKHLKITETFAQMMSAAIEHTRINRELGRCERLAALPAARPAPPCGRAPRRHGKVECSDLGAPLIEFETKQVVSQDGHDCLNARVLLFRNSKSD